MGAYTRTYSLSDGTVAYGSQVAFELDALGSSVNNITNAQISSGAAIADTKFAQLVTASKVALSALVQGTTGQVLLAGGGTAAWGAISATYLPTGSILQIVNTQTGAVATGTTSIPYDDTIPQNTEGDQYMTLSITPGNAANRLMISVVAVLANSAADRQILALFQDSTAGALAATVDAETVSGSGRETIMKLTYFMVAGTAVSTTFNVRSGNGTGATTTFNGSGGNRKLGGVLSSSITIMEFK